MTSAVYSYDAGGAPKDLLDFNVEQQCDIIADYFGWTLWSRQPGSPYNTLGYPAATPKQLAGVLSKFLKDPSYPRFESLGNARRAGRRA